jgi:SAM-dependent methyltransferase
MTGSGHQPFPRRLSVVYTTNGAKWIGYLPDGCPAVTGTRAAGTDPDMRSLIAELVDREEWANVVPVAVDPDHPDLPERVDLVLVVDAFHHLPEPASYVPRLADQLRPGGRVVVIEPRPRWFLFGHATEPAEIKAAMADAGYLLVDDHDFLPRQSFLTFQRDRG